MAVSTYLSTAEFKKQNKQVEQQQNTIWNILVIFFQVFLKDFIYLFLERGRERERKGEKY